MKKFLSLVLAATIICGSMLFTSCSKKNDDNKVTDKIVGKWLYIQSDGQLVATNEVSVTTFFKEGSTLKAYTSQVDETYELWAYKQPTDVAVDGDKLTLTRTVEDLVAVEELTNINISGNNLRHTSMFTILYGGEVIEDFGPNEVLCVRVDNDYSQFISGLWECTELTGGETYNDDNARLEFFTDGTYNYYRKDDEGVWNLVPRELSEYFVDGNYLTTRWSEEGELPIYESWIIASLANGKMEWNSNRIEADGTTFEQVMKWKIIN